MCIYHASWDTHFGFCCDIDEETSLELAREFLVLVMVQIFNPQYPCVAGAKQGFSISGVKKLELSGTYFFVANWKKLLNFELRVR